MSSAVSVPTVVMSDAKSRIWCPFHVAIASVVFIITFFFCGRSIADPDIWWHLKNAQVLLQQHHWIRVDQFSFTVRGTPWVDSEWLSEVLYYAAWRAGGALGLFLLYVGMAEATILGTLYLAFRASGSIKSAGLASLISVLLAVVNFGPRTILFGWACLVALMLVLWKLLDTGRAPLWLIPAIFLLWVNLHGSWLIGLAVLLIVIGSGFISVNATNIASERWNPGQLRLLLKTLGATLAVLFINPYGYRGVFYPFDLAFRQKLNVAHIEEWASVDFHEIRGKIVFGVLFGLLALALAGRRKWKLAEAVMAAFALYISITYVRFLFPAAILLAPILARKMDFVPAYKREIDRSWVNVVFASALLCIVAFRLPSAHELKDDLEAKLPAAALRYIEAHQSIGDRVLNHYTFGGYMILQANDVPTFIDSRTDIFEYKGILKDYLDIIQMKDSLNVIDRYHARYVLFPPKDPVTYMLRQSTRWHLVFEDSRACVFERSI